jgi:hypothetical protein
MTDVTGLALIVPQALGTTPVLGVAEGRVWLVGAFPVFGAALADTLGGGWRTVEPAVNALVTGKTRVLIAATAWLRRTCAGAAVEAAHPVAVAAFASARVELLGAGSATGGVSSVGSAAYAFGRARARRRGASGVGR